MTELDVLLNGFTGTRYILVLENLAMFMISFWKKICISVFYSLHDRRFMSQAGRTRYFAMFFIEEETKKSNFWRLLAHKYLARILREFIRDAVWFFTRIRGTMTADWSFVDLVRLKHLIKGRDAYIVPGVLHKDDIYLADLLGEFLAQCWVFCGSFLYVLLTFAAN